MYLSRVFLNVKRKATMLSLHNPAEMHRNVESCFTKHQNEKHLWFLDKVRGRYMIIMLSDEKPVLDEFVKEYGTGEPAETREYDSLKELLTVGGRWYFRTKVNPQHYVCVDGKWKRMGHVTVAQKQDWLVKQGEKHGFRVLDSVVRASRQERFQKKANASYMVILSTAVCEGVLEITDVDAFWQMLTTGLGQGKAYGCGLFLIHK